MLYDKKDEICKCPPGRMLELMKYAVNYQLYLSKQENSSPSEMFRSVLKDVVPQEVHKDFSSQHLSDFTLSFSKKLPSNIFNDDPV